MKKPLLFGIILTVCVVIVAFVFAQVYPVGMISYWKFDEVSGTTAFDSVDANDGIIYGATWTTGIVDGALSFDGVDDYVITPDMASYFSDETVTIEVWFNANEDGIIIDELGAAQLLYLWHHDSQMEILSSGEVKVRVWNLEPVSLGTVDFGTWHHAVLRYNKATLNTSAKLDGFLDGVEASTDSIGERTCPWESPWGKYGLHYAFGATDTTNLGSGKYFNGAIDEVAIYNRALTPEEIQQHYLNGLAGRGYTAIDTLIVQIMDLGLHKGIEKSLSSQLDNALDSLERGNDNAAIGKLNVFINQVRAQKGKKIQNSDADMLIDGAEEIINAIQGEINGEINFDLNILFTNPDGTCIASRDGMLYIFGGNELRDTTLVYAEEYWGEYRLYLPGNIADIDVTITYNGPDDQVNVSVVTETYIMERDGSNGTPIDGPNFIDLTFNKGETKLVDASFMLPPNYKGLNRFIVKVYINGTRLMTEEAIFCPPDIAQ